MLPFWESAPDWPSLATLLTGLAAIIGAVIIGKRQANISERQSEILAQQTALADRTLRHDLFDRRTIVYEAVMQFVAEAIGGIFPTMETRERFLSARLNARFLFGPVVNGAIKQIWHTAVQLQAVAGRISQCELTGDEEAVADVAEKERLSAWFAERIGTLQDTFASEMGLG